MFCLVTPDFGTCPEQISFNSQYFCPTFPIASFRYVDIRVLIEPDPVNHSLERFLFWNLQFFTDPLLLEKVTGSEVLGFTIDAYQRSIAFVLHWAKTLRSSRSAGPTTAIKSGILARIHLILRHTWPPCLCIPQIEDFLALLQAERNISLEPHLPAILALIRRQFPRIERSEILTFC